MNNFELKAHVICSPKWFEQLKSRYPRRSVLADRNCPADEMFYWNKKGIMRTVYLDNGTVWKSEMTRCSELGDILVPTGYILRIR